MRTLLTGRGGLRIRLFGLAVDDINRVNPNGVEPISIIKDAAAPLYGSRAAFIL